MDAAMGGARRRLALPSFFALAFAISWAAWLPPALAPGSGPDAATRLLGAFGPSLAAAAMTLALLGGAGLRRLLGGLIRWRVAFGWYAFALLQPPLFALAGLGVHVALGGTAPDYRSAAVYSVLPPEAAAAGPLFLALPYFLQQLLFSSPLGEEIGWRGFALPRLQPPLGALGASVVLGLVWGAWHLPLWLADASAGSLAVSFLEIIVQAVLFTWLYYGTGGSLLLCLAYHAALGTTSALAPAVPIGAAVSLVLGVALAALVVRHRPSDWLRRAPPPTFGRGCGHGAGPARPL